MIAGTRSRKAVRFHASTPPAGIAGTSRISGIAKNAKIAKIAETEKPNWLSAYETKEHRVKPGDRHPTAEISLIPRWSRTGPRQPSLLDKVCKRQRAGPRKRWRRRVRRSNAALAKELFGLRSEEHTSE